MTLDELTHLYDRKGLNQYLAHETARAQRLHTPFSIVMIDVDHFKEVNDNLGHLRGDRVLVEVAAILRDNSRQMDIPCRYGGDEFVVILPTTRRSEAEVTARRLLERIQGHIFHGHDGQPDIHLTVSIGIAEFNRETKTMEELLDKADKALYLSKSLGRNRISLDDEVKEKEEKPALNFQSFVDRQQPLDILKEKFNIVMSGVAHFMVVSGEAGIGKTRLMMELKKYCTLHRTLFLSSRPFEYGVTPPFQIFLEPIRSFIRMDESKHLRLLARIPPTYKNVLTRFLPELRPVTDEADVSEKLPADQEKIRLFEAIFLTYEIVSNETPLLLFLDDLQWVRDADLELLGYLLRSSIHLPILFCAAYRIEEVKDDHPIRRFLQAIRREHRYQPIELSGLTIEDVRDLLHRILGFSVDEEWNRRIYEETGGNPFYIEEIVKSLVDSGNIFWDKHKWDFRDITEIQLPGSVGDLIRRRLDEFGSEMKELFVQAAAIGPRFSLKLLKELSEKNEGYLLDILDLGIKHMLINVEREDTFAFSNVLIQRTLYGSISPLRRRRIHLQIAQAIEKLYQSKITDYWETLARHYGIAEDWERVLDFTLKAARRLKEFYANSDAIARFQECLQLLKKHELNPPRMEIDIYKNLSEIYFLIGKYRESLHTLDLLFQHTDLTAADRFDGMKLLGKVHTWLGDFDHALSCFTEAIGGLDSQTQKVEIAELEVQALWIHSKRGEYEKAIVLANKTLQVLADADRDLTIGFVYNILGNSAQEKGDLEQADAYHRQSLAYRQKTGALDEIARGYNNIGEVAQIQGDLERAIENFKKGLDLKCKSGERFGISYMSTSLGLALAELGLLDEAQQQLDESMNIAMAIDSDFLLTYASMAHGFLFFRRGEHDKSEAFASQALDLAKNIGEISRSIEARNILAQNQMIAGQTETALRLLQESEEASRKFGCRPLLGHTLALMADIHLQSDRMKEADLCVQEASSIAAGIQSVKLEALCAWLRSRMAEKTKRADAVESYSRAEALAEKVKDPFLLAQTLLSSALNLQSSEKREDALEKMRKADDSLKNLGEHPLRLQIQDFIKQWSLPSILR